MNINRYNYEEYFLLYVDNELNSSERKAVEAFVQNNPDLEEELLMLKQSQLKPDHSLVLENKSSLFKTAESTFINQENYGAFFLLYVDEELNTTERRSVEEFAAKHPSLQQELGILMQTKLEADPSILFPDKQLLYRDAGNEKVVFRLWRIVAVAAMLLIALAIFWITGTNTGGPDKGMATNQKPEKKPVNKTDQHSSNKSIQPDKLQTNPDLVAGSGQQINKNIRTENIKKEKQTTFKPLVKEEKQQIAQAINKTIEPEEPAVHASSIAKLATRATAEGSDNFANKTLIVDGPYSSPQPNKDVRLTRADAEPDDAIAIGPVETKNKLRGFFRRVTRVVEKTTHLPAAENKSLLIGNFEIALK